MSKQPVRAGDKFRDANGETYTVLYAMFGEDRYCQIEGGEQRCQMIVKCKQLRSMTRVSHCR
jgi:hypothetical protein